MKILFQNRYDYSISIGGDTIQMLKTKEYLEKIGVVVDISVDPNADLAEYDLIHIFNIMRPFETFLFIQNALRQNKKIIMSSIYWDFDEFNKIGRNSEIMSFLYNNFDEFFVEKIKYFKRQSILNNSKVEFLKFFFTDYKKSLENISLFLPNSENEGKIIKEKISTNIEYDVIFNAVDSSKFYMKNFDKRKNKCLTVARIDPRKNILNLVKAFNKLEYDLNIYGSVAPLHHSYLEEVKKILSNSTVINNHVDHNQLIELYNEYKVHVLPSWLETPGLSQLEAAACGCNIVSTNVGSTKEYFKDMAFYCSPNSINSIKNSVLEAIENPKDSKMVSEFVLDNYTWEKTAVQTRNAYEKVLI